jgi:hypothetical protein
VKLAAGFVSVIVCHFVCEDMTWNERKLSNITPKAIKIFQIAKIFFWCREKYYCFVTKIMTPCRAYGQSTRKKHCGCELYHAGNHGRFAGAARRHGVDEPIRRGAPRGNGLPIAGGTRQHFEKFGKIQGHRQMMMSDRTIWTLVALGLALALVIGAIQTVGRWLH